MATHRTDAGTLESALREVLAGPEARVRRLSVARTSVRFDVRGQSSVGLLLDRRPPALARTGEPTEVVIGLEPAQAAAMARGELFLPGEIAAGRISTHGPVRQFLEVEPVLRSLLAEAAGSHGPARMEMGLGTCPSPDLLAIETRDLHRSFGPHHILRGVDLKIPEGVISIVLGPSGTGKSVLLQHILGLLEPTSGQVLIRGEALAGLSRSQVLRLRTQVGVMFQDGALFSAMNVYDNVAFPLRQHTDLNETQIREVVEERLDAVGLAAAADRLPAELSGGMKKRAGLARSLVLQPSIVLCDEPDSGLDPVRTALLAEVLADQHAALGGTMVVITHNIALARRIGQHISVLWQGRVLGAGMRDDMLESDEPFLQQFLAGSPEGPLGMDA